ncbi:MAG: hypothetical protein ABID84_01370 [Chloroflexota bacterium]
MNPDRKQNQRPVVMADTAEQQAAGALSVKDLSDALQDFARVYRNPRTGNPKLADALNKLSRVLQRYSSHNVDEVLAGLTVVSRHKPGKKNVQVSHLRGIDLASIDLTKAKELLHTQELTKMDLIRIAYERFGMPKSRLERQNRAAVLDAIDAALRNEEALDIISEEARREGSRRSR